MAVVSALAMALALAVVVLSGLGGKAIEAAVVAEDEYGDLHFNTTGPAAHVLFNGHDLDALEQRLQLLETVVGSAPDKKGVNVSSLGLETVTQLGTRGDDRAFGVAVGTDDVVFTTGIIDGPYAGAGSHRGNHDIFVAAINVSSREVLWRAQLGSPEDDTGEAVALDDSRSRLYVVGSVWGDVLDQNGNRVSTPPPTSNGTTRDSFVACLNSSTGSVLWARSYGGNKTDRANAVVVVGDANAGVPTLYVAGATGQEGSERAFVTALSGDHGAPLWFQTLQGNIDDGENGNGGNGSASTEANALVVDVASGLLYMGGGTLGAFPYFTSQGNRDVFVAAMNASVGNVAWVRQFGSSRVDDVGGIALDAAAGRILVTGRTEGSILGNRHFGNRDVFVASLSTANEGGILWSRQFGQDASEFGRGIAVLGNGRTVLVTGFAATPLFGPLDAKYDVFAAMLDIDSGALVTSTQFGTDNWDLVNTVSLDPSGGRAVVCGHTRGELSPGSKVGGNDAFVARIHWTES